MALLLFLALVALPPSENRPPEPCAVPTLATVDWQEHGGSSFTLRLPREFQEMPAVNPELEVGAWGVTGRRLGYEFGVGTNPLAGGPPEIDRVVCEAKIDGHVAKVVTGRSRDGSYIVAGYWDDLGRIAVGPTSLTIFGTSLTAEGQRELLAVLWTVKFER